MLWIAGLELFIGRSCQVASSVAMAKTLESQEEEALISCHLVGTELEGLTRMASWGGDNLFDTSRKRGIREYHMQ